MMNKMQKRELIRYASDVNKFLDINVSLTILFYGRAMKTGPIARIN